MNNVLSYIAWGEKDLEADSNYINKIQDDFKSTALIRLEYWNWINSLPGHSSISFWSRSVDHRIICMLAINSSLRQLPNEFRHDSEINSKVSYENIRRLCRCTDKTMRSIIKEGADRGDIIKMKEGRETFITGTPQLIKVFEEFDKNWIVAIKNIT
jgi:hypothetical protein